MSKPKLLQAREMQHRRVPAGSCSAGIRSALHATRARCPQRKMSVADLEHKQRASDELRESERRFSEMLSNVALISMMLDRQANIEYCNDYLLNLTGWR